MLILADGSVCQLDADYVIGREPTLDSAVADGRARPLRLMGASGVVSRIHARVELDGWQVFITDLNSANGTQSCCRERNLASLQPGVRTPWWQAPRFAWVANTGSSTTHIVTDSHGSRGGRTMSLNNVQLLLADVAIIIILARLLGTIAKRIGQPPVLGEILIGILLGPTFFHGSSPRRCSRPA